MKSHSGVQFVSISADQAGQRIDNFLMTLLKGIPKTRVYKMLRKGEVRVNKGRCKPLYKLQEGDQIRVPPVHTEKNTEGSPVPGSKQKQAIESSIIFENQELIVINKPSGFAVHGGSGLNFGVIEILRSIRSEHDYLELVHRLDRDTSGCLLIAKNRKMLRWLHECLRSDKVNKIYHALVFGKWPRHLGLVDAPLKKNELKSGERIVRVDQAGKQSQTVVRVLTTNKQFTLIEAKPITGRTHQIRVHCQHAGHPIVGDQKYASSEQSDSFKGSFGKPRLMLHAAAIEFPLMNSKKTMRLTADYDENFDKTLLDVGLGESFEGH